MQQKMQPAEVIYILFRNLVIAMVLAGCASPSVQTTPPEEAVPENAAAAEPLVVGPVRPLDPQPGAGVIAPGLSVTYFRSFKARHLDHLPRGDLARQLGRPGQPVLYLDHAFGKEEVFKSGEKQLIGMRMQGLLQFPHAGRYLLKAFINDGIRLYLDGRLVLDEPGWDKAGDRFTRIGAIDVSRGSWYPVTVEYYQRKGTATIKLYWQSPQGDDFEIIPAEAYAHIIKGQ